MRSITDMKNELYDLKEDKVTLELEIFNLECKIAEAEAEEEARPYEREFDKYSKLD